MLYLEADLGALDAGDGFPEPDFVSPNVVSKNIKLHRTVLEQMLAEVRRDPDRECCGLLAGKALAAQDLVITAILPATNALASATSYGISPEELFDLFRRIRGEGLEHLGIYHSHPRGENAPSERDIAQAFYPEAAYFILSPDPKATRPVRAFRIEGRGVSELVIEVVSG